MKKLFVLIAIFTFAVVSAQKTAFINEKALLEATPGYEEAIAATQEVQKEYSQEVTEAKQKLDMKVNELLKNYTITNETTQEQLLEMLSENDKEKYNLLQKEQELLNQQIELKEKSFQSIYKEKVGVILNNLNEVITKYCKKNKIEILYKRDVLNTGIVFLEEDLDITEDIIELIKEN